MAEPGPVMHSEQLRLKADNPSPRLAINSLEVRSPSTFASLQVASEIDLVSVTCHHFLLLPPPPPLPHPTPNPPPTPPRPPPTASPPTQAAQNNSKQKTNSCVAQLLIGQAFQTCKYKHLHIVYVFPASSQFECPSGVSSNLHHASMTFLPALDTNTTQQNSSTESREASCISFFCYLPLLPVFPS